MKKIVFQCAKQQQRILILEIRSCKTLAETKVTAKSTATGMLHLRWRVHMPFLKIFMAGPWNLWNCSATDQKKLNFRSDNLYKDTALHQISQSFIHLSILFFLPAVITLPKTTTFLYFHLPFLSFSAQILVFLNTLAFHLFLLLPKMKLWIHIFISVNMGPILHYRVELTSVILT